MIGPNVLALFHRPPRFETQEKLTYHYNEKGRKQLQYILHQRILQQEFSSSQEGQSIWPHHVLNQLGKTKQYYGGQSTLFTLLIQMLI